MKVYIMRSDTNGMYQRLIGVEEDWHNKMFWFTGESHTDTWVPLRVKYVREDTLLPRSDTPYFMPPVQVLSNNAIQAVGATLIPYGEMLPLLVDDDSLFLYNVTNVVAALDLEHCVVTRGRRAQAITSFQTYAFHLPIVEEHMIFKIPEDNTTSIFVTDPFLKRIGRSQLTGFEFRLVWEN